ncbi:MAG: hypothetical protein ACNYZH_00485 [Acidimicrobiia bacterium]
MTHETVGDGSVGSDAPASRRWGLAAVALVVVLVMSSCTSPGAEEQVTSTSAVTTSIAAGCADVVAATIDSSGDTYRVSATILSADTGWDKYADAWEVRALDGAVLGTRILAHPHADEQPFTRSLGDVKIPDGMTEVEIVARDSVAGFCGETIIVTVPGR